MNKRKRSNALNASPQVKLAGVYRAPPVQQAGYQPKKMATTPLSNKNNIKFISPQKEADQRDSQL